MYKSKWMYDLDENGMKQLIEKASYWLKLGRRLVSHYARTVNCIRKFFCV